MSCSFGHDNTLENPQHAQIHRFFQPRNLIQSIHAVSNNWEPIIALEPSLHDPDVEGTKQHVRHGVKAGGGDQELLGSSARSHRYVLSLFRVSDDLLLARRKHFQVLDVSFAVINTRRMDESGLEGCN